MHSRPPRASGLRSLYCGPTARGGARARAGDLLVREADVSDGPLHLLPRKHAVAVDVDLPEHRRHVAEPGDELLAEDELVPDVPLLLVHGYAVELANVAGAADKLQAVVVLAGRICLDRVRLRRGGGGGGGGGKAAAVVAEAAAKESGGRSPKEPLLARSFALAQQDGNADAEDGAFCL